MPPGWEKTVENLCSCIDSYVKLNSRTKIKVLNKKYYFWKGLYTILDWTHHKFIKICPKYNKWQFNNPIISFNIKLRAKCFRHCKYEYIFPPKVKIDQIKEKFGSLRVYYSGGDDQISGVVRFAAYLCSKTCEVTGEPGSLCVRGGWYKTLSHEILKEKIYEGYKPINN